MSVRCNECGAVAGYGHELGHRVGCSKIRGAIAKQGMVDYVLNGDRSTKKSVVVGYICVCPGCLYMYLNDEPFPCENEDCARQGKKGVMCKVIMEE